MYYSILVGLQHRLPAQIWKWLYSPIPIHKRELSLYERCLDRHETNGWPSTFHLDTKLNTSARNIDYLLSKGDFKPEILKVKDAVVLQNGLVITNGSLHPCSSLYSRISPHIFMRASTQFYKSKNIRVLEKASLISRQLIDQGTYGDYFIEFLLPLCRNLKAIEQPLLCDSPVIQKYCARDLLTLGLPPILSIPEEGLRIKDLTVFGPCQPFDNFSPASIEAIRSAFPLKRTQSPERPYEKYYLSRIGYYEGTASKQQRSIENEGEIEKALQDRGFGILRPDGSNNDSVRASLSMAKVIVYNHGSGILNAIWGKPHAVVELASEQWWNPAFIRLCRGLGVSECHVLCTQNNQISINALNLILDKVDQSNIT